jgi:hypothetical protein
MCHKKPAPRKTAFVPRMLFRVAVTGAGVVPFCAAAALAEVAGCSSSSVALGVAAACFCDGSTKISSTACCYTHPDGTVSGDDANDDFNMGVADVGFQDVGDSSIGPGVADVGFSVADVGFTDVTDAPPGMDVMDAPVDTAEAGVPDAADAGG